MINHKYEKKQRSTKGIYASGYLGASKLAKKIGQEC